MTPMTARSDSNDRGERGDWYRKPSWYDILHAPGTAREVDGLERIASRFVPGRTANRWLEPACGTGRYLRTAARRGRAVVGFDALPEMVDYAQARLRGLGLPRSRWRIFEGDMTRFTLDTRIDFAFCLINTARHLMSDRAMLDHLACVARALRGGGVYALGLNTCHYGMDFETEDVWAGARGTCKVTQLVQYLPPPNPPLVRGAAPAGRVERVVNHLTIQTPAATRHFDSAYDLRTYSLAELRRVIGRSAMRVVGVVDELGRDLAAFDERGAIDAPPGGYAISVLAPRERA